MNGEWIYWILVSSFATVFVSVFVYIVSSLYYHYKIEKHEADMSLEEMNEKVREMVERPYIIVQMIFEVLISTACIIETFLLYDWISKACSFLDDYLNVLLLVSFIFAIITNRLIDCWLKQDMISGEDKANIRLISSCLMIIILIYIKYCYFKDGYEDFILNYSCLVLGRFIFYDTSFKQTMESLKDLKKYLLPTLIASGLMWLIVEVGIRMGVVGTSKLSMVLLVWGIILILVVKYSKDMLSTLDKIFGL